MYAMVSQPRNSFRIQIGLFDIGLLWELTSCMMIHTGYFNLPFPHPLIPTLWFL